MAEHVTEKGEVDDDNGESNKEVVGDAIDCGPTTSFNCGEVKCGEELKEDICDEFRGTNATYIHNREVNDGEFNKINKGACDRKVVVDSGECNGEVKGDRIGVETSNSVNCGEVKCWEESKEDVCDEFKGISASYIHNGEVNNGEFNKINRQACGGKVVANSGECNGEVEGDFICGRTTTKQMSQTKKLEP